MLLITGSIVVTGCLSVTFIPSNLAIKLSLTIGGRTIISTQISGIVCMKLYAVYGVLYEDVHPTLMISISNLKKI